MRQRLIPSTPVVRPLSPGAAVNLVLALILVAGTLVRMIYAATSNLNLDEGQFIYDAQLFAQGAIPFVDWTTRAPLLLAFIGLAIKIFGYSFFSGRLVSILGTTVTAYLLYRLGKELASEWAGLIAASLYMFLPFVVYHTIIVTELPVQAAFISLGMYCIVRGLVTKKNRYFFLNGLSFALAYLVRRSSPIYLIFEPLLLLVIFREFREALKKGVWVAYGAIIGLLPLLPLVLLTNIRWIYFQYGAGGLAIAPPPAPDYDSRKVAYNAIFLTMPLVTLSLAFALLVAKGRIGKRLSQRVLMSIVLGMALLGFLGLSQLDTWTDRYNVIPLSSTDKGLGIPVFVIGLICAFLIVEFGHPLRGPVRIGVPVFWLGTISAFYLLVKPVWILPYFMELVPPLCIMSAMAVSCAFAEGSAVRRGIRAPLWTQLIILLVVFCELHVVFTAVILQEAEIYARSWSLQDVEEVGRYIAARTRDGEEIFTVGTAFAVAANRPVVLNISHPAMYYMLGEKDDPVPYDPFGVIPSISEIANYLGANPVRYIVADGRTGGLIKKYAVLGDVVSTHYVLEAVFSKADIYRRIPTSDAPRPE